MFFSSPAIIGAARPPVPNLTDFLPHSLLSIDDGGGGGVAAD
jgi:hypothetical protein